MAQPQHADMFIYEMSSVLPPGYSLEIEHEVLWLLKRDGSMAGSSSYWLTSDSLLEDEAVSYAVQSLHQIQQEIAEDSTEPWPARSGPGYAGFPEPGGAIVENELHLWFGSAEAPVLVLGPIDLDGVLVRDE